MRINYVICVCISEGRSNYHRYPISYHIDKQIEVFERIDIPDVKMITMVVNRTPHSFVDELDGYIKENYKGDIPIEVKIRENWGRSYAAWEWQIRQTLGQYDYYFVTEDDYIPTIDYFYTPFIAKMDDNTAMVCLTYTSGHPSHASGMISSKICENILKEKGEIFMLYNHMESLDQGDSSYRKACFKVMRGGNWQMCFHHHMVNLGYDIKDMREYEMPFREPAGRITMLSKTYALHKNLKQALIVPTIYEN